MILAHPPMISIHAPHARGDAHRLSRWRDIAISIHAPHARGDHVSRLIRRADAEFQSTPLMRGATRLPACKLGRHADFNPRPSCEGRHDEEGQRLRVRISIHAPHARGDAGGPHGVLLGHISIHAPHARGDFCEYPAISRRALFQSTPLMRGATQSVCGMSIHVKFQSTPLMRGATVIPTTIAQQIIKFQSTPLMRGATSIAHRLRLRRVISIHAPHARGDSSYPAHVSPPVYFNPRPSCEGRPRRPATRCARCHFNPRPSCEGRRTRIPKSKGD